ncbi:hypothetical protein OBBRIDRAFT_791207 [Obba rivulosa]|uniref:BTB/POZ domain-containing protein n=1 Tax=Obba rivulosa TaxID=1052685 RepID=A0A8E2AWQ9_9APHY|nr:hypothetical protein OBBRIDRAFT_791207 [Obba rivulosa]
MFSVASAFDTPLRRSADGPKGPGKKKKGKGPATISETPSPSTLEVLLPPTLPLNASKPQVLQAALNMSLTGGQFIDTKFYCFSRRNTSGAVDKPLAVYANSLALKRATPYFENLLSGSFRESGLTDLNATYPSDRPSSSEDYDYDSDSDLDEEEIRDEHARGAERCVDGDASQAGNALCAIDAPLVTEVTEGDHVAVQDSGDLIPTAHLPLDKAVGKGRTIYIKDMGFMTWQALVFYIYTGEISFSPLKSKHAPVTQSRELYQAPPCSPKSMYRLAEKYDMRELKSKALDNIRSQLTKDIIWPELFSVFTSRYPEVQQAQVEFLKNNASYTLPEIPRWAGLVAEGDLPHSGAALTLLLRALMGGGTRW